MASPAESVFAPAKAAWNRSGLSEFVQWWLGELAAMVPAGWQERFSSRGTVYICADASEWKVFALSRGGLAEVGRASVESTASGEGRTVFHRLLAEVGGGATNAWLVLPREQVLERVAVLPLAAEEALRDAVGFELDRLTPLAADNALFDCRVIARDAASQTVSLELIVSTKAPVEARVAQLREFGINILGVGIHGDLGHSGQPLNLLAPELRDAPAISRATVAARVLAGLTAVLAVGALGYPLWQKREAIIDLHPRLEKAKAGADVAERLGKEIERLAAEHNFMVSKKQGQHPAVVLLEDLSRLLPDTTWVQQLDIKTGPKIRELQIAGESASSSQLVELLEKSGSLANANFKSPLTKGVTPGSERFLLAAEIRPRALPEPVDEASLAAKASDPTKGAPVPSAASPPSSTGSTPAGVAAITPPALPTGAATSAAPGGAIPPGPPAGVPQKSSEPPATVKPAVPKG